MTVDQLQNSHQWMHGPVWLSNTMFSQTETDELLFPTPDCLQEEAKSLHLNPIIDVPCLSKVILLKNFSNLKRLIHVTSYVYWFVNNITRKEKVSHLDMLNYAERQWIKDQQRQYYGNVILYLEGKAAKPSSSISRQLDLFLDDHGVIRCSGRFQYANLPYNVKHPILLPKNSPLTTLIIKDKHTCAKHAGIKATLAEVRADFWLPRGKRMVGNIIRSCIVCRRFTAKPFMAPGPPPLPPRPPLPPSTRPPRKTSP